MQCIVDGFVAIGIVYDLLQSNMHMRRGVHSTHIRYVTNESINLHNRFGANRFVVYYHILSCVSLTTLNKHFEKE